MVKQTASLADTLQAIIDKAPGLRAAGVTSVGGEVPFTLAPAEPRDGKKVAPPAEIGDVTDFIGDHQRHGREDVS
jgi:hypothetical protein